MARGSEVTVFVDDAVRGTLPPVCTRDGVPTIDHLRFRHAVGDGARLGAAWLLVLIGPLGWIALLFIAFATSRQGGAEVLSVSLPWSRDAYERQRTEDRRRRASGWGAAAGAIVLAIGWASGYLERLPTPLEALVVASLVAASGLALITFLVASAGARRERVTIRLDASRRWVTLGGVHPDFAAAVSARDTRQDARQDAHR